MTDTELISKLKAILNEIDENEYPEICDIISASADFEDDIIYDDAFYMANKLHEADAAKQLPECVAEFIMAVYMEETENGNPDAACNIGSLYYTGRAGEQDYSKAIKYYTIAADGGCRQAQENLGYCYYYGRNTAVDYKRAFHYFALGAFDGHIRSLYKIGDMYRNGYYVEKNEREAFYIYHRCAQTMTDEALDFVGADVMMRMGDCFFKGIGTDINYKAALEYYQKSELLFLERIENGDFLIRGCYEKVIARQEEIRQILKKELPAYDWVK